MSGWKERAMTRTVTATEAKNRLGALMREVVTSNQPVLIELRGQPGVALISAGELERFRQLDRERRLADARSLMAQIRMESAERNADLTPEQADALAIDVLGEVRAERRDRAAAEPDPNWETGPSPSK
jgi:prevent-host-death family protein